MHGNKRMYFKGVLSNVISPFLLTGIEIALEKRILLFKFILTIYTVVFNIMTSAVRTFRQRLG
jgi:ethanolamine utilization cobalamin adenosyltransferase